MKNNSLTWVEISASAIRHNFRLFQDVVGQDIEVVPVLKSNAYGHGMVEIAKILDPLCRTLAVASGDEALELHSAKIKSKAMVLSFVHPNGIARLVNYGAILPISTLSEARLINRVGIQTKKKIKVQLKIDTGTSRIGVLADQAITIATAVAKLPGVNLIGAYSHFADAENDQLDSAERQLKLFHNTVSKIIMSGIPLQLTHMACTAAAWRLPISRLNTVRLGIGLYGLWPAESQKQYRYRRFTLRPALSWHTRVIQVKSIPTGTSVGYGGTYTVKRKSSIAILPVGYWDGFDRKLSNNCDVLIRGRRCPVVGRVCMNLTMVDVTAIANVRVGDRVTLIGFQSRELIGAEEMAKRIGTINYEVVTRINPLLKRVVV